MSNKSAPSRQTTLYLHVTCNLFVLPFGAQQKANSPLSPVSIFFRAKVYLFIFIVIANFLLDVFVNPLTQDG